MEFEKYSESLTRDLATIDKYLEQKKTAGKKVEVLLGGIEMADTELVSAIFCHIKLINPSPTWIKLP